MVSLYVWHPFFISNNSIAVFPYQLLITVGDIAFENN